MATDGVELTEYGDEATEGLTLSDGLPDSDIDGEVGREYRDGLPELAEYGEAAGELCKYGSVVATPDRIEP